MSVRGSVLREERRRRGWDQARIALELARHGIALPKSESSRQSRISRWEVSENLPGYIVEALDKIFGAPGWRGATTQQPETIEQRLTRIETVVADIQEFLKRINGPVDSRPTTGTRAKGKTGDPAAGRGGG